MAETEPQETENAPESNGKKKGTARRASRAMNDAMKRGDVRAARAIGKTFMDLESKKKDLKVERAKWRDKLGAAEAEVRGAIKSDDDGTPKRARMNLNRILIAFQAQEETEAGRKSSLHLLIEERNELKSRLKKQLEGAKQLGLFDDGPGTDV